MTVTLDLADIQANIVRGYAATEIRHFAVRFGDSGLARTLLGRLVSGDHAVPQVSTAESWATTPAYCLNVALTIDGLGALGLASATLAQFPLPFTQGSAQRSVSSSIGDPLHVGLGDVGDAAPDRWILGGPLNPTVHALLSLAVAGPSSMSNSSTMDVLTAQLRAAFVAHHVTECSVHDGRALPGGVIHFGYRDGISQPTIAGGPGPELPDMQPETPTGDVLLGSQYVNTYGGSFQGALPDELVGNGTYVVFRILEQDVDAFERTIAATARRSMTDVELVAAKLMGRWRNGVPLATSPTTDTPPGWTPERLNDFDYAPTDTHPELFDDVRGVRCPVGAHIRRLNPRSGLAAGVPHNRRLVRRSLPYGPPFDSAVPDDGIERGLLGVFICGDIEQHFEFVQRVWTNSDLHMAGIRGTRDPISGYQDPTDGGKFTIRTADTRDPITIVDLPRLVRTRGSLYCFMPGIGGLRALAGLASVAASVVPTS